MSPFKWCTAGIIAATLLIGGCASAPESETTAKKPLGVILMFSEKEPESEVSSSRMLITDDFLRIDDGPGAEDYVIYDRRSRMIMNIVGEDGTVLELPYREVDVTLDEPLNWEKQEDTSNALPRMTATGENRAIHYKYKVNGHECYDVVAVKDMLPRALQAIREYRQSLAGVAQMPYQNGADNADICDLAINVMEPERVLRDGFPVREWGLGGYQRFLMDYQTGVDLPADLFKAPDDYRRYTPPIFETGS